MNAIEAGNRLSELSRMIAGTCEAFSEPKARWKAMRAIQWRLRGPNGEFVGSKNMRCSFVPERESVIFDGRDNAENKLAFYEACLKVNLDIEILPHSK
jgi:hypothetical protein